MSNNFTFQPTVLYQLAAPSTSDEVIEKATEKAESGEKVSVEVQSVAQYGRTVGNVKMGKDNINAIMVEDGLAWVYREYVTDTGLIELENAAKEKGLGLWADANPIYPADFRKANK